MAFIATSTTFYSFAEYSDVTDQDSRLFVANEGLTQTVVEDLLVKSSSRILNNIRATAWWQNYFRRQDAGATSIQSAADVPAPSGLKIISRKADFTDLCVYHCMMTYILPKVANFGNEDNEERQKISFYENRYTMLFEELITSGDWYDFSGDGTITSAEKEPGKIRMRRTR